MAEVVPTEASTEARLEAAALHLIERDGVLAGLNLREVADVAKVTRGLVYHHFGNRRALLRAALERSLKRKRSIVVKRLRKPAPQRVVDFFEASLTGGDHIRLLALLLLDGEDGITALPMAMESREAALRDIALGYLPDDMDPDALQAGLIAATYGWILFRTSFAKSLGRDPEELDSDVVKMLGKMWANDNAPQPQPQAEDSE